jgi:ABC-2 type transport system permease protein
VSPAAFAATFRLGLQDTFVYRWNILLRSLVTVVPLLATVALWDAVFASNSQGDSPLAAYGRDGMTLYFIAAMIVHTLVTPTEDEWRIAAEIRDGQVSALVTKPIDHLAYRLSLFLSSRLLYTAVTLPVIALVLWTLRTAVHFPVHPETWFWFALSTAMAALIQFFVAYSLAMLAFWFLEVSTVIFLFYSFEYFLSGNVFPLDLLPASLAPLTKYAIFTYELYFPITVFLERLDHAALQEGIVIQAAWVVVSALIAKLMWNRGIRRYEAVGI